jgi:hypothetical protein
MAKTVTISQAEYEYMKTVIAHDGMTIARYEVELAQAKEDIKRLLVLGGNSACEFCKKKPPMCYCCEMEAEWRGYRSDAKT